MFPNSTGTFQYWYLYQLTVTLSVLHDLGYGFLHCLCFLIGTELAGLKLLGGPHSLSLLLALPQCSISPSLAFPLLPLPHLPLSILCSPTGAPGPSQPMLIHGAPGMEVLPAQRLQALSPRNGKGIVGKVPESWLCANRSRGSLGKKGRKGGEEGGGRMGHVRQQGGCLCETV